MAQIQSLFNLDELKTILIRETQTQFVFNYGVRTFPVNDSFFFLYWIFFFIDESIHQLNQVTRAWTNRSRFVI